MAPRISSETPTPEKLPLFYEVPPMRFADDELPSDQLPITITDEAGQPIESFLFSYSSNKETESVKADASLERERKIDIGHIARLAATGDNPITDAIRIATYLEAIEPTSGQRMANLLRTLWPLSESNKHLYKERREEYSKDRRFNMREERLSTSLRSQWEELSEEEKRTVSIEGFATGSPLLTSFTIKTSEHRYQMGRAIEVPGEIMAHLNHSDRALVERRVKYWHALDVHNAAELQETIEAYFERVPFDPEDIEMKWLHAADPTAYDRLISLTAAGHEVYVWRMVRTPDSILDNVRIIAEHYYGSHMSWLAYSIRTDVEPLVVPSDIEELEQKHARARQRLLEKTEEGSLKRELLMRIVDENFEKAMGHEDAIATIFRVLQITRSVEVTGDLNEEDRYAIERANAALTQGLGREFAARKVPEDDSTRTSESGIGYLKGSILFSILDEFIGRGISNTAAEGIGGFSDDVLAAIGDRKMLDDAGIPVKDLRVFTGILGVTTAAMAALATQIDRIGLLWGDAAKGFSYEIEATGIGVAMTALVTTLFAKKSKRLSEEDKLPNHIKLPPDLEQWLKETNLGVDDVIDGISASLEAAGMDRKRLDMHLTELRKLGSLKEIMHYCLPPNAGERLRISFNETVNVNPARGGIVKGQAIAWVIGTTMGWLLMKDPAAYTFLGGAEVPIGLGLMTYDKKVKNPRNYRKWVEEDTQRLQRIRETTSYGLAA